jgi:tetratricopeptide (TPR) repeat protein
MAGAGKPAELFVRATAAADAAIERYPQAAAAYVARAVAAFVYGHDFGAADAAFSRALGLAPDEPFARSWYARFLSARGRHDAAVMHARAAVAAEPLSLTARRDLIDVLFAARRYDSVVAEARELLALNPQAAEVQLGLAYVYLVQKREREALDALVDGLRVLDVSTELIERVKTLYENDGMPAVLRAWLQTLQHDAAMGRKTRGDEVALCAALGEYDRCFELLETALHEADPYLAWLDVSPLYDALRADPRYERISQRLRTPQPFPNL